MRRGYCLDWHCANLPVYVEFKKPLYLFRRELGPLRALALYPLFSDRLESVCVLSVRYLYQRVALRGRVKPLLNERRRFISLLPRLLK
jgi:hypothetical protein